VHHLEEFHVAVNNTIDVLHGQVSVFQRQTDSFMYQFRLVDILTMAGMLGLSDAYYSNISIFLFMCHCSTSLRFHYYNGLVLPGPAGCRLGDCPLRAFDLAVSCLVGQVVVAFNGPGRASEKKRIAVELSPGQVNIKFIHTAVVNPFAAFTFIGYADALGPHRKLVRGVVAEFEKLNFFSGIFNAGLGVCALCCIF
jgi:hypothetical protein